VDWIYLADVTDKWQTVVKTVMKYQFPCKVSEEGLCSKVLIK
jgi:hypothetical protein